MTACCTTYLSTAGLPNLPAAVMCRALRSSFAARMNVPDKATPGGAEASAPGAEPRATGAKRKRSSPMAAPAPSAAAANVQPAGAAAAPAEQPPAERREQGEAGRRLLIGRAPAPTAPSHMDMLLCQQSPRAHSGVQTEASKGLEKADHVQNAMPALPATGKPWVMFAVCSRGLRMQRYRLLGEHQLCLLFTPGCLVPAMLDTQADLAACA